MIVWHGRKFVDGHVLGHGSDDLVYQLSAKWTDAASADDLSRGRIGQELHETILCFHDQRFAVIAERIARCQERNIAAEGFLFGEPDDSDRRIAKDDLSQQPVID